MAEYKIGKNKKKVSSNAKKIVGITMIALSCLAFFFLLTNLVGFMQNFLLGAFGYFAYPMFVAMLLGGVALLNNKKYKMSKKYAIFLYLTIFFLVCIIQLAIVGNKSGSFGDYLASNYTRKHTAGGIVFGFFTTCILYLTNFVWAFVIFSVLFAISLALYIDAIIAMKKKASAEEPVKLSIKEVKNDEKTQQKEEVNVVMSGNIEKKLSREEEVRQKLGLTRRGVIEPISTTQKEEEKPKRVDPKTLKGDELKSYLLTPPQADFSKFFSPEARSYARNGLSNPSKSEIDRNINSLKKEEIPPIISDSSRQNAVTDAQPEQLVSEADNIIREVMEESNFTHSDSVSAEDIEKAQEKQNGSDRDFDRDRNNFDRDRNNSFDHSDRALDHSSDRVSDRMERDFSRDRGSFDRHSDRDISGADRSTFDRDNRDLSHSDRDALSRDNGRNNFDRSNCTTSANQSDRGLVRDGEFAVPDHKKFVDFDNISNSEEEEKPEVIKPYSYTKPPIDLVTTRSTDMSDLDDDIQTKTVILENTLEEFGVPAKVQNVVIGPAVTRYELEMPSGITVKKILNLSSDIALALEANGGDVRIEAPVPGRNVVGIEVPNDKVATVSLKDVLISNEFNSAKSPLTYAVGKDITGRIMVGALNKMPHLLIAGTTGSGKSVMLNSIIISLLYKSSPDDCKLLLIDPKQVEFTPYEGIPHLIVPKVISDLTKATNALQWAVDEMERRFRLIREARVRDIDEYNSTPDVVTYKKKKMPFIVIIIDEFSDFIMQGKKEVEDKIIRLGQKARAAGIHIILATQYPTTEYVTGGIKANFPSRIAFKVASNVNSVVILGQPGAEKLLGHGDMLYAPQEYSAAPKRVQGCFITTREIADIVNYVTLNNEPVFDKDIQDAINNAPKTSSNGGDNERGGMDPLLPEALKMCIDAGQASTSMIQRRLSIGYPRAGKIIDQMTEMGYISAADGAKPRNVYITLTEYYQIFGDKYE